MMMSDKDELTPEERQEFEKLPQSQEPSRLLEERTVRALKDRGLLRATEAPTRTTWRAFAAAAVAASLALFMSGVAVGQWLGSRQTVQALTAVSSSEAELAAAQVQSRGSALAMAMSTLAEAAEDADPETAAQARDVAVAALWSAAVEVVRVAPDDAMVARILQEFERAESTDAGAPESSVVWF